MSELPKFTVRQAYVALSRWIDSAQYAELADTKGYRMPLGQMHRGNTPWGWPLVPSTSTPGTLLGDIYFARDRIGGIKIGISQNPGCRVLNMSARVQLLLTISGCSRAHEQALHRLVAPDCINGEGEWFMGPLVEGLVSFLLGAAESRKESAA